MSKFFDIADGPVVTPGNNPLAGTSASDSRRLNASSSWA